MFIVTEKYNLIIIMLYKEKLFYCILPRIPLLYIIVYMVRFSKYLNRIIVILICFLVIATLFGCDQSIVTPDQDNQNDNNIVIHSYVLVKGNPAIVKDCTPELFIFTDKPDVAFMSFSGDSSDWSDWVKYSKSYDKFNIASGLNGTNMDSGLKTVYVRFKDINSDIFPNEFQETIYCQFEYEMQPLFSLEIEPERVKVGKGESHEFVVKGYDHFGKNEVPLDGQQVEWKKTCGVGKLNPTTGFKTVYTAPDIPGTRDISAHYGKLGTGAWVEVVGELQNSVTGY